MTGRLKIYKFKGCSFEQPLAIESDFMEIIVFKYGETKLSESMVVKNGDNNKFYDIALLYFLIRLKGRNILIDVGCDNMPGFVVRNFIKPYELLKEYGISYNDITDVIITHAHHDHIHAVKYYKNAIIHIQKQEYENGKSYIPDNFKVETFDDFTEIENCLDVIKIGGHSEGSCIVKLNFKDNKYLFVGDECYDRICFEKEIPSGSTFSLDNNIKFIKEYKNSEYKKIFFHENNFLLGKYGWNKIDITPN